MHPKTILLVLKLSAFFVFFGRGYEHLFWDAPFRTILWDQALFEPIVNGLFNTTWETYVSSMKTDAIIQGSIRATGILYMVCAVLSLLITFKSKAWIRWILGLGGVSLVILAILLTKEKFYHFAMFFEHSIQFGVPFVLIWFASHQNLERLKFQLKAVIALTFTCHGIYALGMLFPLPGNFVTMTLNLLPVSEPLAKQLLIVAAILDFIIAIGIFIPKIAKYALAYAAFWGIATAFARIGSGLTYDVSWKIIHQYLYPTIYRIPHGLIPLLLFFILRYQKTLQFAEKSPNQKALEENNVEVSTLNIY